MWEGMVDGWWSMHDGCELANSTTRDGQHDVSI